MQFPPPRAVVPAVAEKPLLLPRDAATWSRSDAGRGRLVHHVRTLGRAAFEAVLFLGLGGAMMAGALLFR